MNKNSTQRFALKRDQRRSFTQYLNANTKADALTCVEEILHVHRKCIRRGGALTPEAVRRRLEAVAGSLRGLIRPATIDADTLALIEAPTDALLKLIDDRIKVLRAYRRPHGNELERYTCGMLRLVFERYGSKPKDRRTRRRFVADVLDIADINYPDPSEQPGRLDEWIETPVAPLDPAAHVAAANEARSTGSKP